MYLYRIRKECQRPRNDRGAILVIVLWLIVTVAIFGLGLSRIVHGRHRFIMARLDGFISDASVDGLLLLAKYGRLKDKTPQYDTLGEFPFGAVFDAGSCSVTYSLVDEEGKVNINHASSDIIKELPGMDKDKAIAIVNSPMRPFRRKEELLLLDEIDEEDYYAAADYITVHGMGRVNINTCPGRTLELLGLDEDFADKIVAFRKGEDGETGTDDDGYFESASEILDGLRESLHMSLRDEQALVSLMSKNLLDVKSDDFELVGEISARGRRIQRFSLVFGKENNRYRLKELNQR